MITKNTSSAASSQEITQEQYFALNNKILTRSKIMDYLKCPNYFYRKHITGEIAKKNNNPAFAIGGGVDDLLAQIETSRNIIVFEGDRRKPAINAEYRELIESGKNVVTSAQYDQIIGLASAVEETTAYKQIKNYKKQVVLSIDIDKPSDDFNKIAGMPDFIEVDDKAKHVSIIDLKTAQTIEPNKYYWHCEKYGYFYQAALYTMLVNSLYPQYTTDFKHITVEKSEPYRVATFIIPQNIINTNILTVQNTIDKILLDKDFKKRDVTWEDAIILGGQNSEDIWGDDGEPVNIND